MHTKALLLTAWYFPIRIVHWQTAIKMVYEQSVDVVVAYDEEVRSPSVTWKMPAVLRLKKTFPRTKRRARFSRANVYLRDDYRCQYCGLQFEWSKLTFDHIVPRSKGGRRTFTNIVTACRPCNARKADLSCDEAGMFPLRVPMVPKALPISFPDVSTESAPEEWSPFLPVRT